MPRRPRDERGAISVWFATASLVMIILVGMAVDLGGKVHTQQRTRSVAAQAARTGAQEVQGSTAVRGEDLRVDITAAKSAAQDYLRAAGVNGTVTVTGGDTLVVRTTDTYNSKFLGIIGLDAMQVTGEASARLIRAEGGIERLNTPTLRQRLTGLLATAAVLGIVIGLPVAFLAIGANPIPDQPPTLDGIKNALLAPDDGTLVLGLFKVVGWVGWAFMALSLILEAVARLRRVEAPKLPGLRRPAGRRPRPHRAGGAPLRRRTPHRAGQRGIRRRGGGARDRRARQRRRHRAGRRDQAGGRGRHEAGHRAAEDDQPHGQAGGEPVGDRRPAPR